MTSTDCQSESTASLSFTGERILPYASGDILQHGILAIHQALYRFIAPYCRKKHVLDLGCGTGHGTALLSTQPESCVWGTDIALSAVRFAAQYAPELTSSLLVSDACHLALGDSMCDVVSMVEVIEHVPSVSQLLSEVGRVIKPDGVCFISTPNRLVASPDSVTPHNPFHRVEYTYEEFLTLLTQSFRQVRIQCVVVQQRSFLVRYYRHALRTRLPFALAHLERFLYWHVPPWNRYLLQPQDILFTEEYTPACLGFLALCTRPVGVSRANVHA